MERAAALTGLAVRPMIASGYEKAGRCGGNRPVHLNVIALNIVPHKERSRQPLGDNSQMNTDAVPGAVRIIQSRATLAFSHPREVGVDDMRDVVSLASTSVLDAEVLMVRPVGWTVDETRVASPIGAIGSRLSVDAEVLLRRATA